MVGDEYVMSRVEIEEINGFCKPYGLYFFQNSDHTFRSGWLIGIDEDLFSLGNPYIYDTHTISPETLEKMVLSWVIQNSFEGDE